MNSAITLLCQLFSIKTSEMGANPVQKNCNILQGKLQVCLRSEKLVGIDFLALKTFCYRFVSFAYFLKIPNASWLRSFRLAWGLDRKNARRSKLILTKSALNIIFSEADFGKNMHLFFYHLLCSRH